MKTGSRWTYRGQEVALVRWEFEKETGETIAIVQHTEGQSRDVIHVKLGDPHLQATRRGTTQPARNGA